MSNAKADFNKQRDEQRFDSLAPALACEPAVIESWGVLNVAQVAQLNGEMDGCWSVDYLICSFCGTIGCEVSSEIERECQALWDAASQ